MERGRGEEERLKLSPWLIYWGCWERCISSCTILIDGEGSHCENCVKGMKRWGEKSCGIVVMAQAPGWGIEDVNGRRGSVRLNKFRGEVHSSVSPLQDFKSQLRSLVAITKMTSTTLPLWALDFSYVKSPTIATQCVLGWGYTWGLRMAPYFILLHLHIVFYGNRKIML